MLREERGEGFTRLTLARTAAGRPLYTVCVYQLGDTLIDSGPAATAGELLAWARGRGVRRILHTHHHEDHTGGSALLARELGVEVIAPEATVGALHRPYTIPPYRRAVWGQPVPCPEARPLPERLVVDGLELVPVATPGHAHDHVVYWAPERGWLLSGDLYVARRVMYLRGVENAWLHLDSLRRALALRPRLLLCGHGGAIDDGAAALAGRIEFWDRTGVAARRLYAEGVSIGGIRKRLLGSEGAMTWLSLGDFSKRNLIASLLFHDGPPAEAGERAEPAPTVPSL